MTNFGGTYVRITLKEGSRNQIQCVIKRDIISLTDISNISINFILLYVSKKYKIILKKCTIYLTLYEL